MTVIFWNCRGSKGFSGMIRDMQREHSVNFIVLMETHVKGEKAVHIGSQVGLDGIFIQEARWHSGGIWCMWD